MQRDRFIRNWRRTDDRPDYPRYKNLRTTFVADWMTLEGFVTDELSTTVQPNQCEVTYVNIIETSDPSRLDRILACISESNGNELLGSPESEEVRLRYVLKDEADKPWGRLHVTASPAIRSNDSEVVVRVSLTARGAPPSQDAEGAMTALDRAHEAVVRGFTSITTPEMHTVWGRKS